MAGRAQTIVNVAPGAVIFRKGDAPDRAYVVMDGLVEISDTHDGQRVVLTTIQPLQLFGELALLEDTRRSSTATSVGGCTLLSIDRKQLLAKLNSADPFIRYWALYLTDRIRLLSTRVGGEN